MQLAYQTEQNRQQIKAQTEALDALRKLREEVNETEKLDSSSVPKLVADDQGSRGQAFPREGREGETTPAPSPEAEGLPAEPKAVKTHIDIRA
jgi:hypothetical protein